MYLLYFLDILYKFLSLKMSSIFSLLIVVFMLVAVAQASGSDDEAIDAFEAALNELFGEEPAVPGHVEAFGFVTSDEHEFTVTVFGISFPMATWLSLPTPTIHEVIPSSLIAAPVPIVFYIVLVFFICLFLAYCFLWFRRYRCGVRFR